MVLLPVCGVLVDASCCRGKDVLAGTCGVLNAGVHEDLCFSVVSDSTVVEVLI